MSFCEEMKGLIGAYSEWRNAGSPLRITQDMVDEYIKLSRDTNPIHRAGSRSVIPGGMLLMMLTRFADQFYPQLETIAFKYNKAAVLKGGGEFDFPHFASTGSEVQMHMKILPVCVSGSKSQVTTTKANLDIPYRILNVDAGNTNSAEGSWVVAVRSLIGEPGS